MLSGVGFEDAQKVDVLDQLTVRPSCLRIAAIRGKQLMRLSAVVLKLMSSMKAHESDGWRSFAGGIVSVKVVSVCEGSGLCDGQIYY